MKKIERYNLVSKIASHLQSEMNTSGINIFLSGFGIEHEMVSIVPSKRVYVEQLLSNVSDNIILQIARELEIETPKTVTITSNTLNDYLNREGFQSATHDFERALEYLQSDVEQALGSASSTLESICKSILDAFSEGYPKDESMQPLLKAVFDKMDLSPEGHADPDIKRVLGGLLNSAIGIGVLRTKYSGAHGKGHEQKKKSLAERHARLAVNATTTIGLFLVETYNERYGFTK